MLRKASKTGVCAVCELTGRPGGGLGGALELLTARGRTRGGPEPFREGCRPEGAYRRGRTAKERESWEGKGVQHVSSPVGPYPCALQSGSTFR